MKIRIEVEELASGRHRAVASVLGRPDLPTVERVYPDPIHAAAAAHGALLRALRKLIT